MRNQRGLWTYVSKTMMGGVAVALLAAGAGCGGQHGDGNTAGSASSGKAASGNAARNGVAASDVAAAARRLDTVFTHLGRAPSDAERRFWTAELHQRPEAQVREYARLIAETTQEIYRRAPTADELVHFTELLDRGVPL